MPSRPSRWRDAAGARPACSPWPAPRPLRRHARPPLLRGRRPGGNADRSRRPARRSTVTPRFLSSSRELALNQLETGLVLLRLGRRLGGEGAVEVVGNRPARRSSTSAAAHSIMSLRSRSTRLRKLSNSAVLRSRRSNSSSRSRYSRGVPASASTPARSLRSSSSVVNCCVS